MILNDLSATVKFVCLAAAMAMAMPTAVHAGEITRPDSTTNFQWKTTECPRPIEQRSSPGESSEVRLMRYARDIEIYIECIQREAQRDFQKAQVKMQEAIERDLEKQTQIMNDMMLRAAKTMR